MPTTFFFLSRKETFWTGGAAFASWCRDPCSRQGLSGQSATQFPVSMGRSRKSASGTSPLLATYLDLLPEPTYLLRSSNPPHRRRPYDDRIISSLPTTLGSVLKLLRKICRCPAATQPSAALANCDPQAAVYAPRALSCCNAHLDGTTRRRLQARKYRA